MKSEMEKLRFFLLRQNGNCVMFDCLDLISKTWEYAICWYIKRIMSQVQRSLFFSEDMSKRSNVLPQLYTCPTMVNVHTTSNSTHKLWIFTILKPYFNYKNVMRYQMHLDRRVHDCIASSHQVKSDLASHNCQVVKFLQFQNSVFPTIFNCVAPWYNG